MTDDDNILGTRVPDHAIHRASMWLEQLQFGERRREAGLEHVSDEKFAAFIEGCGLPVTPEQLQEAVDYYAQNFQQSFFGTLTMAVQVNDQILPLLTVLRSVWLDGFRHGAATATGKRGLSNAESDLGREV